MRSAWARRVWERKGLWASLLWTLFLPLSFLYLLGVQIRNALYFLRCLPSRRLPCAVVSVGNLTVGGTGKTPTTLWLARELKEMGYRVVILSRGYKGSHKNPLVLDPSKAPFHSGEGMPVETGDEAVMMAYIYGQKVVVGKNRYKSAKLVLQESEPDVILLDDGFQHRALRRDVDILLLGSDTSGWPLPAGPFREPHRALNRAHLFLVTSGRRKWESALSRRSNQDVFYATLEPKSLKTLDGDKWREYPLSLLARSKILAVSGVANPSPFYRIIYEWDGEIVDTMEFPDHHSYTAADWQRINRAARNVDLVVTTEKDILKLSRFPFARDKLMALQVQMKVQKGEAFLSRVTEAIRRKKGFDVSAPQPELGTKAAEGPRGSSG